MIDAVNPFGLHKRFETRERSLKADGPARAMTTRFQKFGDGGVRSAANLAERIADQPLPEQ